MDGETRPRPGGLRDPRLRAIACVIGSAGLFAVASAAVKALGGAVPLSEVVLFRNAFAIPPLLIYAHLVTPGGLAAALRTRRPLGHLERLATGLVGMYGAFYGYAQLPLATVTALNFTMPLFLTGLSVLMLGERFQPRRLAIAVAGFGGVLLMVEPWDGGSALDPVAVAGVLAAALGWALAMISIRRMGEAGESGTTIVLWFAIGAAVVSGVASVPVWVTPTAGQWGWLALTAFLSVGAQILMTAAYRAGDTTLIAPFEYTAILWTASLGMMVWGEVPDLWDLFGVLVLVGAGLAIWRTELIR
ncbi:DMT family transporter [Roseomonas sp. CCTCC AB2023176]|uniref:DMT family transporter n=1 Tax=Roseomonas sp. CCTCC AB2023176 TaxID=3342640 RepID=UPI0035DC7FF8